MKVGISTASYFGKKHTEDAISVIERLGAPVAEVNFTSFCEYTEEFGKEIAKRKGKTEVYSVHTLSTQYEPQIFNPSDRVQADAFYWLERAMQAAKCAGAHHYTFHGHARAKRSSRTEEFNRFPFFGAQIKKAWDVCEKYGVELCLENVEWATYNRVGIFRELLPYCPSLRGVLDIKQARIAGYPVKEYISEMKGRISHVHVSDLYADGKMCLPGKGETDFDRLFCLLSESGFDGPILIEAYKEDFSSDDEMKVSMEYLSELLEKRGLLSKE